MNPLMPVYDLLLGQPEMSDNTSTLTSRESLSKLSQVAQVLEVVPSQPPLDQNRVGSIYTYSPKTTSISFPWPKELTGLERIALSAKGDLQRVLSAFFARPITIATVYSNTFYHPVIHEPSTPLTLPNPAAIASASRKSPITQTRQVHLQCSNKNICTATSTVRITSPIVANLFLVEKYAIGQTFSRMGKTPEFELVSVGLGPVTDEVPTSSHSEKSHAADAQLWRKYRLYIEDFECEILEVFPTREMFAGGLHWLEDTHGVSEPLDKGTLVRRQYIGLILFLGLSFLLMLAYIQFFFCPS
ncbi:hypothetical protein C0995_002077 [Termitomyces sp. Mi166|nr:hypothetical protein C0995_002077 [Termitomyces sp. Mi166\